MTCEIGRQRLRFRAPPNGKIGHRLDAIQSREKASSVLKLIVFPFKERNAQSNNILLGIQCSPRGPFGFYHIRYVGHCKQAQQTQK